MARRHSSHTPAGLLQIAEQERGNGSQDTETAIRNPQSGVPSGPGNPLDWLLRLSRELTVPGEPAGVAAAAAQVLSDAWQARVAIWQERDADDDPVADLLPGAGLPAGSGSLGDTRRRDLVLLAHAGFGPAFSRWLGGAGRRGQAAPPSDSPAARVWNTEQALAIGDPASEHDGAGGAAWRNMARREGIGGGWAVPLPSGGTGPIGVLECYFAGVPEAEPMGLVWARDESGVPQALTVAAGQIAAVLTQARMQERMGRRLAEALLLREVSQMIGNSIDLEDTLAAVLASVRRLIPYTSSEITLYDAEHRRLVTAAVAGEHASVGRYQGSYNVGEGYSGWLAVHKRPLVVADVDALADPRPKIVLLPDGIIMRSYIGLPLLTTAAGDEGEHILGTIEVMFDQPGAFGMHDVRLLQQVADEAAIAIQNAQVYRSSRERLDRRLQELNVLQRIGRELNATWDLRQIFDLLAREAVQAAQARSASIIEVDQDANSYFVTTLYGLEPGRAARYMDMRPSVEVGVVGRAIRTGEIQLVPDVRQDPDYYEIDSTVCSELVVPIRYEDQIVGVLNLESDLPAAFDDDALRFVEALADQAAIAVGNAQNYEAQVRQGEQLLRRASQLNQVLEISNALTGEQPLEDILDQIVHAVTETAGFNIALLSVVESAQPDLLQRVACAGLPLHVFDELRQHPTPVYEVTQRLLRPEFRLGRAYFIGHEHEDAWPEAILTSPGVRSDRELGPGDWNPDDALFVPLTSTTGEFLGILSVDDPEDGRRPTRATIETIGIFANQAAIAIENAQLFDRYKHRINELATLNQLAQSLASLLKLEDIGELVYQHISQFMPADAFYIATCEAARQLIVFPYTIDLGERVEVTSSPMGPGLASHVIQTGSPLVVGDLTDAEQRPSFMIGTLFGSGATRSWVGVPLTIGREVIGVLSVQSYRAHAFSIEQVQVLTTVANQCAVAVQNARLFAERERRINELATLNQIARDLSSSVDLDVLLDMIYQQVARIMDATNFDLMLWHPERNEMEFRYNRRNGKLVPPVSRPPGSGISPYILRTRQPVLIQGDSREYCERMGIAHFGTPSRSFVGVPLVVGERVLGALLLQSTERDDLYDQETLTLLSTIAAQAAVALENAQLFEDRERRITELSILNEVARDLTSTLDQSQLMERLLGHVMSFTGANTGGIFRYDGQRRGLRVLAMRGIEDLDAIRELSRTWPVDRGLMGRSFRERQTLLIPDVSREPGYVPIDPQVRAELIVPILKEEAVLGIIEISSYQLNGFDEDHLRFVGQLASQAAVALHNSRLYDEAQTRILQLDTLNQLGSVLSAALDRETVFQTLYERIGSFFDVSAFFIGLVNNEQHLIEYPFMIEIDEERGEEQRIYNQTSRLGDGLSSNVLNTGKPLLITDMLAPEYADLPGIHSVIGGTREAQSWMGAPLFLGPDVIGLISVQSFETGAYTPEHLQFLTILAHHAAVAIQNAHLFAEIRRFNEELEQLVSARTQELAAANRELLARNQSLEELYQISHQLTTTLELDQILQRGLQLVTSIVGVRRGSIMLKDLATGNLVYRATVGRPRGALTGEPMPFRQGHGVIGWVERERKGVLVQDVRSDPRWVEAPGWGEGVRSLISVPLLSGDDLLGVLNLTHEDPNHFDDTHLPLVSTVANEMSVAIHNATLYSFITEQFEREAAALREQESETSKLNAVLGSITDGVVVFDSERTVILANAAAERLFGIRSDEVIGKRLPHALRDLDMHPDALDMMSKILALPTVPDPLHPWQKRFRIGEQVVNVTISRVSSMQRELLGVVMVFRDVTKEVEVDRMKSEFISLVSHEMRTPMTSIKGYTDLILMGSVGPISEMQKNFLNVIKNNADRLTALIADLLDLSRIETGRIKLDMKYVQLEDLINEVVATLRTQMDTKGQQVVMQVPWGLPDIKIDRDRIVQVLTNLVSNAHKYTPEGGTITVRVEESADGTLAVSVHDTGIGIAPRDQERLFTRFFRADDPGVQAVSGTGLGLVIARSLVEMHGGSMEVASTLGQGSTFRFTLPVRIGEEVRPPPGARALEQPTHVIPSTEDLLVGSGPEWDVTPTEDLIVDEMGLDLSALDVAPARTLDGAADDFDGDPDR